MRAVRSVRGPAVLVAAGSAALGVAGALYPVLFAAVLGAAAMAIAAAAAYARPGVALRVAFLGVLLAQTKFRFRDPSATLSGDVDGQVIFELGLYAAIGVASLAALLGAGRLGRLTRAEWIVLAYVGIAATSVLWSYAPLLTAVRGLELAILLVLALASMRVLGAVGTVDAAASAILLFVLLFATIALLVPAASGSHVSWTGFSRFAWFAVHPIECATYASLATIFVLCESAWGDRALPRRRLGVPSWLYAGPLLGIVFLTRSRGPALALVAALMALGARRAVGRRWTPVLVVLTALVGTLALLAPLLDVPSLFAATPDGSLLSRVATSGNPVATFFFRGQSAEEIESFSGRAELWRGLTVLFLDRPVLGYGYQGARALVLGVMPWAAYAHNAYVETLLDVGMLGSVPLLLAAVRGLASGSLQAPTAGDVSASSRAALFAVTVFLLVNSVTAESFAAAPGFETLALFVCAVSAGRLRADTGTGRSVAGGW